MVDFTNKVLWGGLYKVKHTRWKGSGIPNDQVYYQAVPALDKDGNLWMQDTYQLSLPTYVDGSATLGAMNRIFKLKDSKSGDWAIRQSRGDFYHTGNEKITSQSMLDDYELICDLHDWRPLDKFEDYRHYDAKDVLHHIHLYKEHGYSWDHGDIGVTLIRKSAQPVLLNKLNSSIFDANRKCTRPDCSLYTLGNLTEVYEETIQNNIEIPRKIQVSYDNTLWLYDKLKEMQAEIRKYMEEHKYVATYAYELENLTLGQIHPDMKRYLEEDCYCPGEIYGLSGLGYQIYTIDTKCQLILQNDRRTAVIARTSNSSDPQVIVFWHDDLDSPQKIIEARRIDATINNVEVAKSVVNSYDNFYKPDKIDEFNIDFKNSYIQPI